MIELVTLVPFSTSFIGKKYKKWTLKSHLVPFINNHRPRILRISQSAVFSLVPKSADFEVLVYTVKLSSQIGETSDHHEIKQNFLFNILVINSHKNNFCWEIF